MKPGISSKLSSNHRYNQNQSVHSTRPFYIPFHQVLLLPTLPLPQAKDLLLTIQILIRLLISPALRLHSRRTADSQIIIIRPPDTPRLRLQSLLHPP